MVCNLFYETVYVFRVVRCEKVKGNNGNYLFGLQSYNWKNKRRFFTRNFIQFIDPQVFLEMNLSKIDA